MKNKKILSLLFVAFLVAACSYGTASAFEGRDDLQIPGGGGGGGSGGAVHKLVWTHYSFNTETGKTGQEIWLVPQYITDFSGKYGWNSYQNQDDYKYASKVVIDGECARAGVGFWALTLSTDTSYKISNSGYYDPNLSNAANGSYRNETQYTYLTSKKLLPAASDSYGTYKSGSTYLVYRNASSSGYAPYHTVSFNNNNGISYGLTNNEQTLYYYDGSRMYAMYTSDMIASSQDDIYESYATFYKKQYGETISKEEAPSKMGGSDGTYAFCSFGSKNVDNTINSKTSISIDGTTTSATSDWNDTATNPDVYITNNNKIKLTTKYTYSREDDDDSTVVATFNKTEKPAGASVTSGTGTIESGVPDTDSQYLHKEYTISEANKETTICSSTSHSHLIEISEDGTFTEINTEDSEACVKVKYVPAVAEIDSKTTLYIGPTATESGWDSSATYSLGEVNYGANVINATWSYTLSSSKRCFEGDFKNGACSENETSITSSFKVPFNRVGDVDNNSGDSTLSSPGYSAAPEASTKSYDLLPGEPLKQKQGISHKSGVRMNGDNASGSKDEESSVAFTVTAKNAVCNINGLEFGLNSPYNYGRMTIYKNGMSYNYGNGKNEDGNATWETHGPLFFKPEDRLKISYDACLGQQIKADKDSGRSWDTEWINNNAKLTVGITGSLLDLKHFAITGNAVSTDSAGGRNILAYEVLGKKISSHVGKNYQFKDVGSNEAEIGNLDESSHRYLNLGRSIASDFSDLTGCPEGGSSCKAHAVLNIPYNYILEPKINPGSKDVITVGDSNAFTLSILNHDTRVNKQVQDTAYHTNVKPGTRASYLVFAASTASTTEGLLQSLDGKFVYGDKTGDIQSALSGLDIQNAESGSIGLNADGSANKAVKVNSDKAIDGYNKICAAVAVYPADSHNMQGEKDIDNDSQYDALTDDFGAAYTRISVSCKTVGKYPTASVEGSGIVTSEEVKGSYTTYNDRNFGSWSEYGLIANSVTDFASGASVAYAISNPQTVPNRESDPNSAGLKDGDLDSLQTHGNLDKDNVGLQDASESSVYYSQVRTFVDAVKSSFFDEEATNVFNLEQVNDSNIYVNKNHDKNITIGEAEAQKINNDVPSGSIVIIYTSGNISISNKIEKLNATLIAEDTIDTCAENGQGGDNGQLLDDCYNQLVVNGVVYSGNAIKLDRVYGGGSTSGMNLDAQTLVQRAEVFNYNPDYIKSIYQYTLKAQPLTTTYIEELSTRY